MAKKRTFRQRASRAIKKEMHEYKLGRWSSRAQAIAVGLAKTRRAARKRKR